MSHFNSNPEEFLGSLEPYLDQGPGDDYQALKEIPVRLTEFAEKGRLEDCQKAVQVLGTALGKQQEWQGPFRECGILTHAVQRLNPSTNTVALAKQYLRVIGNCVADNDENRETVVEDFDILIACFRKEDLATTALAVMFNLCNDYDPAQAQAAKLRLDSTIAENLVANKVTEEAVDYAVDLLTWTTENLTPSQVSDIASIRIFENILDLSFEYDEDHYQDYVTICVHYLENTEFQQKVATPTLLEKLFDLILDYERRLSAEGIQGIFSALSAQNDPTKMPLEDMNAVLMVQLVNSLSAISASDAFVDHFSMTSSVVQKARSRLQCLATFPSGVCACVMLGNLATSDQMSIDMVEDMGLHLTLIRLLSAQREPALIYAAAGFMRHLAFPEQNRIVLGDAGLIETCCRLLLNNDPSVRGEAAAILCKLISNNFQNIEKVVYEAIPDDISLTQLPDVDVPAQPTLLYHIVAQALVPTAPLPSTSMKNAMIEIGRTIIAILRYLGQSDKEKDAEAVARHIFKTPMVARPVARLVRQRLFAEARSEGLLGLGLMAHSHEGAICVVEEMQADDGLLDAIKEFATSQENQQGQQNRSTLGRDQQNGSTLGRDQQNALVLLHGLAANGIDAMDPSLNADIDTLQRDLSKLLV
ncbi:ARM repeat-containing protein [Zopfia rhizophila CBS 207.26]|uniref:ARM repeat-containing protein n=1 Tax=Zopfia rhizophila CBS 207.26 TaxID=1314779 RepID=A0A6A6EMJ0_9PEZI|nr:ARM repeat-containing protein [Zopfia rhizophila CBS 207.26]